jgi:uncharacterized protein YprB with RNaseH-like and TPR domain
MQNDPDIVRQLEILKQFDGPIDVPAGATPSLSRPQRSESVSLEKLFPHAERLAETPDGAGLWRVRTAIPADGRPTREGYACPAAGWGGPPDPATVARLTGETAWGDLDPATILYLDTETTGLATGAGSLAFLVGLGRFGADGRFELEQFYIDDFAAEPLLIEWLDERLRAAGALVTYNGRTFDLPLLTARWTLQRRLPCFPDLHLDLLPYARRLWRRVLPGCGLANVEQHVLNIRRMNDLPSAMIPGIWLDAVRGSHPERLTPVFDHHAQDIASMGALVSLMTRAVAEPEHPAFARAEVQWGLALLAEARGDRSAAIARLESAATAARDPDLEHLLSMRLGRTYKRMGLLDEAVALWKARAAHSLPHRLDPLIELAKHAEHVLKDWEQARRWTERALAILQQQEPADDEWAWYGAAGTGSGARADQVRALERRLARQLRKAAGTKTPAAGER